MSETNASKPQIDPEEKLPEVYVDDMLMTLKYYVDEQQSHIQLKDTSVCQQCGAKICLNFCPVGAYQEQADGKILIAFQSCIECGTCRVMCPENNVNWQYPRGGFGVAYKFG